MKKILFTMLILSILFMTLTGCNTGETPPAKPQAPADGNDEYEVAVVVKVTGIPFFNVFEEGVKKAGEELGINAYVTGPTDADPAQQVRIIEDLISTDIDALVVVPNDATALEAVLERARDKGIIVIANESPGQIGADYDVEMINNKTFAEQIAESAAQSMGGKGEYAMFVGGLSVPLHNTWADYVQDYLGANYPDMTEVTDRIPCGEDADLARSKTLELLTTYPNLNGIIGFGSLGPIGAAEAIKEKGLVGDFTIVGTVVPSAAASYLSEDSVTEGFLWNPADSGYATVFTAKHILDGGKVTDSDFSIPNIGKPVMTDDGVLSFDNTLRITKDNANDLGF
jgi:simple sugar transport system substrate-binding protein